MNTMEIVLLICGAAIFVISFLIPQKKEEDGVTAVDGEEIRRYVEDSIEDVRERIEEMTNESVQYAVERTESYLDRVSNEKINAVNEYSESVLEAIDKNHQEVVFLYDMLNDKSVDLKNTVREAQALEKNARDAASDLQALINAKTVKERENLVSENAAEAAKSPEENFVALGAEKLERIIVPADPSMPAVSVTEEDEDNRVLSAIERLSIQKNKEDSEGKTKRGRKKKESNALPIPSDNAANMDVTLDVSDGAGQNKNERILALHRDGKSNVEIARELGLGMGEVKLVIDLFEGTK